MTNQNITFKEDVEMVKRLDNDAKRRGLQRSDVIREALREKYPNTVEAAA